MVEKMKKSLLWCLVCLVCLVPCSGAALAAEADAAQDAADGYVYDEAGLLTADEIADLNDEIASFMEESGWNVYAVTTDDAQGKSATAYADDFFDEHSPDKEDGVALLIDMDNREITISTCGIAIRYLTDSRIDDILDAAYAKISNGDYNGCMHSMLTGVENYYEKGISEGQYNYDSETGKISRYHVLTLGRSSACWRSPSEPAASFILRSATVTRCAERDIITLTSRIPRSICASRKIVW